MRDRVLIGKIVDCFIIHYIYYYILSLIKCLFYYCCYNNNLFFGRWKDDIRRIGIMHKNVKINIKWQIRILMYLYKKNVIYLCKTIL